MSFEYLVDDLSSVEAEELRGRAMTALAKVALFCLKRARTSKDIVTELERWQDALREVTAAANGREALFTTLRYILQMTETPAERVRELTRTLGPKAEEPVQLSEIRAREDPRPLLLGDRERDVLVD